MKIIEWFGVIMGIIAVYLLYKNSIFTWVTGYLNIVCFMIIFWHQKLFGDFVVQIIFLLVGIWGWANWYKSKKVIPQKLGIISNVLWIIITFILWVICNYYLKNYTKCSYPYAESLILALSITGQILTAQRKIENWYYWLLSDLLMSVVYFLKELYPTTAYSLIILVIGIFGLIRWNKLLKAEKL